MAEMLPFLDFFALVDRSLEDPRAAQELERRYKTQAAVVVIDFSGMVRRTKRAGIIRALAMARAAMSAINPTIQAHDGQIVKRIADTMFVVFASPYQALSAALDAQVQAAAFRGAHPDDPIHAGIGLGWGDCLVVPGVDLFGSEVNQAFVLGEEIARSDEILLTQAFLDALRPAPAGVGVHATNSDRAHAVGFNFFEVRDYRD